MPSIIKMPKVEGIDLTGLPEAQRLIEKALPYFAVDYDIKSDSYKVSLVHGTRMYEARCRVSTELLADKTETVQLEEDVSYEKAISFTADSIALGLAMAIQHCLETYLKGIDKVRGTMTRTEYLRNAILGAMGES